MQRKIPEKLLFTLILFFAFLFSVNSAMGFSDEPCYGVNYDCASCQEPGCEFPTVPFTAGPIDGWTVKLESIVQISFAPDPGLCPWRYKIYNSIGTQTGLNVAGWLSPDCCTAPKVDFSTALSVPDNLKEEAVGVGIPSTGFAKAIQSGFVVWGTPVGSSIDWDLVANTDKMTMSTVFVAWKGSKGVGFEAPVPGCAPAPLPDSQGGITPSIVQCLNNLGDRNDPADNARYVFWRKSDNQGCIDDSKPFYVCKGLCSGNQADWINQDECTQISPAAAPAHVLASGLQAQKCEDEATNTTFFDDNPHYLYEVWSGGYYYVCCLQLDPTSPNYGQCEAISNCGR